MPLKFGKPCFQAAFLCVLAWRHTKSITEFFTSSAALNNVKLRVLLGIHKYRVRYCSYLVLDYAFRVSLCSVS